MLGARLVSRLRPKAFLPRTEEEGPTPGHFIQPQSFGLCSCLLLHSPGVDGACSALVQAHSSNLQFSHRMTARGGRMRGFKGQAVSAP